MSTTPITNKSKSTNASAQEVKKQKVVPAQEEIATKAYEIWLSNGQKPGCDQTNWFEAESQLSHG